MRLVRFQLGGQVAYGRLDGIMIQPVEGADITKALAGKAAGAPVALALVRLLAPVARP